MHVCGPTPVNFLCHALHVQQYAMYVHFMKYYSFYCSVYRAMHLSLHYCFTIIDTYKIWRIMQGIYISKKFSKEIKFFAKDFGLIWLLLHGRDIHTTTSIIVPPSCTHYIRWGWNLVNKIHLILYNIHVSSRTYIVSSKFASQKIAGKKYVDQYDFH